VGGHRAPAGGRPRAALPWAAHARQADVNQLRAGHEPRGAREAAGLPERLQTHGLRRGLGTWIAEGGTKDVRDRVLAHVDRASVDSRYAQAALDQPAREWWAKWADYLTGLTAANVVQLVEQT